MHIFQYNAIHHSATKHRDWANIVEFQKNKNNDANPIDEDLETHITQANLQYKLAKVWREKFKMKSNGLVGDSKMLRQLKEFSMSIALHGYTNHDHLKAKIWASTMVCSQP